MDHDDLLDEENFPRQWTAVYCAVCTAVRAGGVDIDRPSLYEGQVFFDVYAGNASHVEAMKRGVGRLDIDIIDTPFLVLGRLVPSAGHTHLFGRVVYY